MYLNTLKIWNFRKYGVTTPRLDLSQPALTLRFNKGLNLLVGENDSGKTTMLDAIRHVLLTQSREYMRITPDDFFIKGSDESSRADCLRIECRFDGFSVEEAGPFLDWLGIVKEDDKDAYYLRVWLEASRRGDHVESDVRAGADDVGVPLAGAARDLLRVTYLKPLRDSDAELTPGRNSRLAQILASHRVFSGGNETHPLVGVLAEASNKVEGYFRDDPDGKVVLEEINNYLTEFQHQRETASAGVTIARNTLRDILSRLSLQLNTANSGLGTQNILFIATELLLLKREDYHGLRLALIEEVEAHLHPQAQLRVVDYLQNTEGQFILTSHSPNLASKVKLENLILVHGINAYPLGRSFTELYTGDYDFLERFLDVTKANMFFAKGVILVESDSENILLPVIAEILDRPLHKYGVSIVNVGSTAFLRYSRVFLRKDATQPPLNIPVAVVTDLDIPEPDPSDGMDAKVLADQRQDKHQRKVAYYSQGLVKAYVSPAWTLEFELMTSTIRKETYQACLEAKAIKNSGTEELSAKKVQEIATVVSEASQLWKGQAYAVVARQVVADMREAKVSKAVTAQCLAGILMKQNATQLQAKLLKSTKLAYLVQAIEYVTEALPHDSAGN